jgi:hypothetical protein
MGRLQARGTKQPRVGHGAGYLQAVWVALSLERAVNSSINGLRAGELLNWMASFSTMKRQSNSFDRDSEAK